MPPLIATQPTPETSDGKITINPDLISRLNNALNTKNSASNELAELSVNEIYIQLEIEKQKAILKQAMETESSILNTIKTQYGDGTLDLNNGIYTKNN